MRNPNGDFASPQNKHKEKMADMDMPEIKLRMPFGLF
jgi:hypothetical protein